MTAQPIAQPFAQPTQSVSDTDPSLVRNLPIGYLTATAAGMAFPLIDRDPFTPCYELARTLLDEHFRYGHTASTMLSLFRDGAIDISVVEIDLGPPVPTTVERRPEATSGILTRLVITTAPQPHRGS